MMFNSLYVLIYKEEDGSKGLSGFYGIIIDSLFLKNVAYADGCYSFGCDNEPTL